MSGTREVLARDKERLLARSALCRMRLRRQVSGVRESLRWRRVAGATLVAPSIRYAAFGLAVSWIGLPRAARIVRLVARGIVYTRLASSVIEFVRALASPGSRGIQ